MNQTGMDNLSDINSPEYGTYSYGEGDYVMELLLHSLYCTVYIFHIANVSFSGVRGHYHG